MPPVHIVVGYDGSPGAEKALRWALEDSSRTGRPVSLVCAFEWREVAAPIGLAPPVWPDDSGREDAQRLVAEVLARARGTHPDVMVSGAVVDGSAAAVLVDQSGQASMVVVGSRGRGGFAGLLLGSTSVAVSAHAHCPVVVVRGEEPSAGAPVVVGFDDSAGAHLAVEFGFAQAAAAGASLHLVHAWAPPPSRSGPPRFDPGEQSRAEQSRLTEVIAGWRGKYPSVASSVHVVAGPAAPSLIDASRDARLVVVGSRGRGGFEGMMLGSVSQQLLYHAHCPVAVVRQLPDGGDRTLK